MKKEVQIINKLKEIAKPLIQKYHVKEIYIFGSYARGEADENSDLDILIFGGDGFRLPYVLALGEELRELLKMNIDIFEIREINQDSEFYKNIMAEKVLVS